MTLTGLNWSHSPLVRYRRFSSEMLAQNLRIKQTLHCLQSAIMRLDVTPERRSALSTRVWVPRHKRNIRGSQQRVRCLHGAIRQNRLRLGERGRAFAVYSSPRGHPDVHGLFPAPFAACLAFDRDPDDFVTWASAGSDGRDTRLLRPFRFSSHLGARRPVPEFVVPCLGPGPRAAANLAYAAATGELYNVRTLVNLGVPVDAAYNSGTALTAAGLERGDPRAHRD
jgi:hypothetical protein